MRQKALKKRRYETQRKKIHIAILNSRILFIKFHPIHGWLSLVSTGIVNWKDKNHMTILTAFTFMKVKKHTQRWPFLNALKFYHVCELLWRSRTWGVYVKPHTFSSFIPFLLLLKGLCCCIQHHSLLVTPTSCFEEIPKHSQITPETKFVYFLWASGFSWVLQLVEQFWNVSPGKNLYSISDVCTTYTDDFQWLKRLFL